jgi:hypothetical protein
LTALPRRPSDLRLLVHVLLLVLRIRRLLPRIPLPALLERLTPRRSAADPLRFEVGVRYADAVLARMPIGVRGDCLPRSLVIYHLALRAGIPVQLHCGARRTDAGLDGHAWCTSGGVILAGARSEGFAETYRSPATLR